MSKLTAKQQRFVEEYLKSMNAVEAAALAEFELNCDPPCYGYYVYGLICPIKNDLFYIGKGSGKRLYNHEQQAKGDNWQNEEKTKRIRAVLDAEKTLVTAILSMHSDESEAYACEEAFMADIGYDNLTNISRVELSKRRCRKRPIIPRVSDYATPQEWAMECLTRIMPRLTVERLSRIPKKCCEWELEYAWELIRVIKEPTKVEAR